MQQPRSSSACARQGALAAAPPPAVTSRRLARGRARSVGVVRFRREGDRQAPAAAARRRPAYAGYSDDAADALRRGMSELRGRWDGWPPEERRATLGWLAGGGLVLVVADALLRALEPVPLLPGALQAVGFAWSCWFYFRYVLTADGRRDLARDATLEQLFGGRNRADAYASSAPRDGPRLSNGATSGYGGDELSHGISGALHDLDGLADELAGPT